MVYIFRNKIDAVHISNTNQEVVAIATADKKVQLLNLDTSQQSGHVFKGHCGSVRCLHVSQELGVLLTGSFDTSVR